MGSPLEIAERRSGPVAIVSLRGWLTDDEQDVQFRERIDGLVRDGILRIVVDLHDITLFDSGSAGVLVAKLLTLRKRGGDLRLARLNDRTRRVLTVTRLTAIFAIFESVEAAVQSFEDDAARTAAPAAGPDVSKV